MLTKNCDSIARDNQIIDIKKVFDRRLRYVRIHINERARVNCISIDKKKKKTGLMAFI